MSKTVKLQMFYKNLSGDTYQKTLTYINPNVSDEILMKFVTKLNALTTNQLGEVFKIVNDFLNEVPPQDTTDELITPSEIAQIFTGDFVEITDTDGVTQIQINSILDNTYQPTPDNDPIPQSFFDELFNAWEA